MATIQLKLIVSGGQTGADQAGLRAARALGFQTGGYAPLGWLTEEGPAEWLELWGLEECEEPGYAARTKANAREVGRKPNMMFWFGSTDSPGRRTTMEAAEGLPIASLIVVDGETTPRDAVQFIECNAASEILWVAGNRESVEPGIGDRVERFLRAVLRLVREGQVGP